MKTSETPLARALLASGLSANALANEIGTSRQNVGRWVSGKVKLPLEQAQKIAPVLSVSVAELMLGIPDGPRQMDGIIAVSHVHVRGNVQAGVWTEFEEFAEPDIEYVPSIPGRWSKFEQFAFKVAGNSMNLARLFDGDYVICVPYWLAKTDHSNNEIVVVERRSGGKTERTVKQVELGPDGSCLLWPRSDDPRFRTPIPCHGPEPDGTEIEIIGLVIGSFTPR